MKNILWPMIHKFRINNNLCLIKYPWGWMPYNNIKELKTYIPKTEVNSIFPENLYERERYHITHFDIKVKDIYSSIFTSYFNKDDFIEHNNITPRLSNALNFFNRLIIDNRVQIDTPNINLSCLDAEILGSWVSMENTTCNSKFLGLWDEEQICHEILTGCIGPEIKYTWDQRPIKQNVRVLFNLKNRIDIWDFERCLMTENTNWKVSNINNILI